MIEFERVDGVAVVTLSRPDLLNSVTPAMVELLLSILDRLATDTATRGVGLTGAGRAFTAGMDIRGEGAGTAGEDAEPLGKVARTYHDLARSGELITRLRDIPQPVIAALHGPVAGMGMSMALACDLRVADPDAALALAGELLARSPFGLRHTKELLNLSLDASGLRGHLALENRTQTMAFHTEDLAEGLAATQEKRETRKRNST